MPPIELPMPSIGTVKSLSTISWDRLRSPLMALGSTMIRTKGASIRVLVNRIALIVSSSYAAEA
nr:hypothetical protein [Synechococcus sp. PROS-9-1]